MRNTDATENGARQMITVVCNIAGKPTNYMFKAPGIVFAIQVLRHFTRGREVTELSIFEDDEV